MMSAMRFFILCLFFPAGATDGILNSIREHGACSCYPLKYTHIDLASHVPKPHHLPYSGNPVLALSYCYLIQGKCLTIRNDLPFEMQYVCEADCKPICIPPCQPCAVICDPCCTMCPQLSPQVTESIDQGCPAMIRQTSDPCCQPPPSPPPEPCRDQCQNSEPVCVMEPICRPNVRRNGLNNCG